MIDLSGRVVLQVNLDGAFLCLREAARVLVGQGQGGSLVGVSSTSAVNGNSAGPVVRRVTSPTEIGESRLRHTRSAAPMGLQTLPAGDR